MSTQITVAFVQQYKSNVISLYQQGGSRLRGTVREQPITGKQHFFERVGATKAQKRTSRHADTPQIDTPHSRRMVTLADYEWADLVDDQDKIRLLISPESEYAINGAKALSRAFDQEVIDAFDGVAKAGETGSTSVNFTDSGEGAADLDFSSAAVTTANLLNVKRKLDDQNVPMDGRFLVCTPALLEQLLKQSTAPNAASADYNSIKALVRGELDTWIGFKWIMIATDSSVSFGLPSPATNMRYCFAWHRDAMGIALGKDITTRISERADKSYSVQVYLCGTFGATRVQGPGVVRFKIDETK